MPSTHEVAMSAGVTYRQLDYWCRSGYIVIGDDANGSGSRRRFTSDEAADVAKVGQMLRKAHAVGLEMTGTAVAHVWNALQTGREWRLVLDTHEVVS